MENSTIKPKIILVDDNEAFLDLFLSFSETDNFDIIPMNSAESALKKLEAEDVDLIVSDVQLQGITGIELFKKVQDLYPAIPVILITAFGSSEKAIQAVKQGAFHYFEKPIDNKLDLFWATVREALEKRRRLCEIESLQNEKSFWLKKPVSIIGQSKEIRKVFQCIHDVADLSVNVFISGDTGTGKELVARAMHDLSRRRNNPFFAVNCSQFAPGILESELFGHEKGSFTGADYQKKGLFELSDKGTLFLDEISDAPASLQAKLLRVIETHTLTRVGGAKTISSDFRIISATNSCIEDDVSNGRFRQDLFYRLNVYSITLPPLRKRKDDIPLIANYYIQHFSKIYNRPIEGISDPAIVSLMNYDWPGNVRELVNVIERAVITCRGSLITSEHLPFEKSIQYNLSELNLKEMEKFYIELALKRTNSNKTHASKLLGISRKTLIEKVKKYQIDEPTDEPDKMINDADET